MTTHETWAVLPRHNHQDLFRVDDSPADSWQAIEDIRRVMASTQGEISDASARYLALSWATQGSTLHLMGQGYTVSRAELSDDIARHGRLYMGWHGGEWPKELELLATWVLNHD